MDLDVDDLFKIIGELTVQVRLLSEEIDRRDAADQENSDALDR